MSLQKIPYAGKDRTEMEFADIHRRAEKNAEARALLDAAIMELWRSRRHDTFAMARKLNVRECLVSNRLAHLRDSDPEIRMSARY